MYANVDFLEDSILFFARSFKNSLEEQRNTINKINEITGIYYEVNPDLTEEKEDIISELNNSLLITIYGKCESLFNMLCSGMQSSLDINLSYMNLNSSGVNRALNYLEGVNLIKRSNINSYDKINSWRIVRNHLTHDFAVPHEKNRKHIEKTDVFWCGETETLRATKENCAQLLEDMEVLFNEIEKEILTKIEVHAE